MSQKTLSLSRAAALVTLAALVGCTSSASEDARPAFGPGGKPGPTQEAAEQNSKPPVPGAPLEGVFVSSSRGVSGADGSMQRPFKTLGEGIQHAQAVGKRVIACAETYPEQLTLQSGVSVYGYFSCDAGVFVMSADKRARVEAPVSPALVAEAVTLPTRLEGFDVVAPDGTDASPSSIAARVAASRGLVLGKSSLRAGAGKDGEDGVDPAQTAPAGADGAAGLDAGQCPSPAFNCFRIGGLNAAPGGAGASATACGAGIRGGAGGLGGAGATRSSDGRTTEPATSGGGGNAETAAGGATAFREALPGANGADGGRGTDGATGVVELTAGGARLVDGTRGSDGAPGQGGGGGGGSGYPGGTWEHAPSGGGGGAGGCPGLAGTPGTSGGASVGLYLVDSEVILEDVEVVSASAGRAGAGTLGVAPTAGGSGGAGLSAQTTLIGGATGTISGGAGGAGGRGGGAGASGHGAPGPSIGVVVFGAKPVVKGGSIKPGAGGQGAPEVGPGLPATAPGASVDVLVVK